MPKCERCSEIFPPNYVDIIKDSKPMLDGEYPKECIFCKLMISEVERETENNSGKYVAYTKQQCIDDYKNFLKKIKESKNVKDILNKAKSFEGIIV